jgi:hypothetical protein
VQCTVDPYHDVKAACFVDHVGGPLLVTSNPILLGLLRGHLDLNLGLVDRIANFEGNSLLQHEKAAPSWRLEEGVNPRLVARGSMPHCRPFRAKG